MSVRQAVGSLIAGLVVLTSTSITVAQSEKIHSFHSDIDVLRDGSLRVTETITVTSGQNRIKRGIYRDFPTLYRSRYFVRIELPFDVVSVKRDGTDEPYHTEQQSNGVRLYIGRKNYTLPPDKYTYEIIYTTNYQLGYFEEHDELYWNVTGNGWEFPIEQATARVRLPSDVPRDKLTHEGYTGLQNSRAKHLTSQVDEADGTVSFATTRVLGPREGLTVVVGFSKGFVDEPTKRERSKLYFKANLALWVMLGGLLVVFVYYICAWVAVGRDPPGNTIVPLFQPPLDLPPACMRFLHRCGYDRKCFTAALLNMAVKKWLTIDEEDGEYTLRRNTDSQKGKLSPGEQKIARTLLNSSSIKLEQKNHSRIGKAIEKLGERLSSEFEGKLFFRNRWWLLPGWLLSALAVMAGAVCSGWQALGIVGFLGVWLSIWTCGCGALAGMVVATWRSALALRRNTQKRLGSFGGALFLTVFAIPFFIGETFGLVILVRATTIWMMPMLVGLVALNWTFWHLIRQPTVEGRRIMDQIEGFRMYLGTAEQEYLQRMHPPEQTPELFEKYLPYALALDVENKWAERFSEILQETSITSGQPGDYHPDWYRGRYWNPSSRSDFASILGSSLGQAISSSSTAPGSSSGSSSSGSGFSGGGFSGGGGGGGGGGGW
ncbi:MAG: DUF2207 domain-containing protein [Fuerstiella sp.]|nr:DUF2207 domain-containing protein [Fuerstiella sp.]